MFGSVISKNAFYKYYPFSNIFPCDKHISIQNTLPIFDDFNPLHFRLG